MRIEASIPGLAPITPAANTCGVHDELTAVVEALSKMDVEQARRYFTDARLKDLAGHMNASPDVNDLSMPTVTTLCTKEKQELFRAMADKLTGTQLAVFGRLCERRGDVLALVWALIHRQDLDPDQLELFAIHLGSEPDPDPDDFSWQVFPADGQYRAEVIRYAVHALASSRALGALCAMGEQKHFESAVIGLSSRSSLHKAVMAGREITYEIVPNDGSKSSVFSWLANDPMLPAPSSLIDDRSDVLAQIVSCSKRLPPGNMRREIEETIQKAYAEAGQTVPEEFKLNQPASASLPARHKR